MYLGTIHNAGNLVSLCSDAYDISRSDPLQVYANLTGIQNLKDLTITNLYTGAHPPIGLGQMGPLKLRSLEMTGNVTESRCKWLPSGLSTIQTDTILVPWDRFTDWTILERLSISQLDQYPTFFEYLDSLKVLKLDVTPLVAKHTFTDFLRDCKNLESLDVTG